MSEVVDNQESASDVLEYRSLSVLAVTVTVLGVFSAVALVSPLLWVVPLLTIVLAVGALRSLAKNPEKIGRRAVVFAIVLAVFFGAWAPSRYFTRQWWLYAEARARADEWLELVCTNELRKAHQLHVRGSRRVAKGKSVDEFYDKTKAAQSDVYAFFDAGALKIIVAQDGIPTFEFVGNVGHLHTALSDTISLRYLVRYEDNMEPKALPIKVVLECDMRTGRHDWIVQNALEFDE